MEQKLNVVLITVDQMRRDCIGASGNDTIETPHLDMMKHDGYMMSKAYSAVPSCIAARAALLTGLSQKSNKRLGYRDGVAWDYEHTIASEFAKGGYHTQCIGKMHVFPERNLCGFHNVVLHDGYLHSSRDYNKNAANVFSGTDDYLHWLKQQKGIDADITDAGLDCNSWVARTWPYEERLHPTNWVVSESIDFLRRRDTGKPFFLHMSFVRPHSPLDPPEYYYNMYKNADLQDVTIGDWADTTDAGEEGLSVTCTEGKISAQGLKRAKAAYYGLITHIDHQIGRFLQALTEYRMLYNTVFLFTSDHGDLMGDHNMFRKSMPYEGSAGIPFLIYDPGKNIKGTRNKTFDNIVELRDVMPTLLDIAGLEIPQCVEGNSLLPVIQGEENCWREYLHGEHSSGMRSNHYIVTKKDKYIWFSQTGKEQYFDLSDDPKETKNVVHAPSNKERVELLRNCLIKDLKDREEGYSDGVRLFVGRKVKSVLGMED